jgi:hypothetical protein
MGLTPEGWVIAVAAIVGSVIVGRTLYTKVLQPKEQTENSNTASPPVLYNGVFETTTLGGSKKKRQRKNKSRRK